MSKPMLRLVTDNASSVRAEPISESGKLSDIELGRALQMIDIQAYEARNGSNAYTRFVKANAHLPSPEQARVIGLAIGKKVRADDGKLYPLATAAERLAAREQRISQRQFSEKFRRSTQLYAAICGLAEMDVSPEEIELFYLHEPKIETKLRGALEWLNRFAYLRGSDAAHSCSENADACREIDCQPSRHTPRRGHDL